MTTGERIKKRRKEIGVTPDDIASKLGVSRSTIFRYENGDIEKLPTSILEPLAEILLTTPAHLMGWKNEDDFPSDDDIQYVKTLLFEKGYKLELYDVEDGGYYRLKATDGELLCDDVYIRELVDDIKDLSGEDLLNYIDTFRTKYDVSKKAKTKTAPNGQPLSDKALKMIDVFNNVPDEHQDKIIALAEALAKERKK